MNQFVILFLYKDINIKVSISYLLKMNDYFVQCIRTDKKASLYKLGDFSPDLILMEFRPENTEDYSVLHELHLDFDIPILAISRDTTEAHKVKALDGGADDFIQIPYQEQEFLARVRVCLRRRQRQRAAVKKYRFKNFIVDFDAKEVYLSGRKISLTKHEYRIVCLLAKNAGKVLTHDYIVHNVWGSNPIKAANILRVNMTNIRHKLHDTKETGLIQTIIGVGYKMPAANERSS